MLEHLSIRNFQKHVRLEFDFDPLVTVLVGRSDVGKSAVLRALRWLCVNRPSGDGFLRHGADYVRVTLKIDGHTIKREKCGGENVYRLDGQEYHAFGQGVPDSIATLLNLDDSLNFQGQHDPQFWLSLTSGEVSRQLNSIINLGLIDTTLANLSSAVRKAKAVVDVTEGRLKEARETKDNLAWVVEAHKDLQEIENLQRLRDDNTNTIDRLQGVLDRLSVSQKILEQGEEQTHQIETVITMGAKVIDLEKRLASLTQGIEDAETGRKRLAIAETNLETAQEDLVSKTQGLCPLCGREMK